MSITKPSRGMLDTGISDSSDATTLSFDSSENALFHGHVDLSDNKKIRLGIHDDLEIYHSTHNYIKGVNASADLIIQNEHIALHSSAGQNMLHADTGGALTLFHAGNSKLATSSDGIDVTGHIDSATITTTGNVTIGGNLTVNGTTTSVNSTTMEVADLNIQVAKNATTSAATNGAGLTFGAWSSGTIPRFEWSHSDQRFFANKPITANLVGNVTGNVSGTAATVTTAAQTNITSLGTLTSLEISGVLAANGYIDLNNSGNRGKIGYNSNHVYIGSSSSVGSIIFKNNISSGGAPHSDGDTLVTMADAGMTVAGNLIVDGGTTLGNADTDVVSVPGPLAVDTDTLYVDVTNDRVSINSGTSPTEALHVTGNIKASGKIIAESSLSTFYDRIKILNGSAQLNIGQWDTANHRIEGDANRPIFITSYHSGGISLGSSGATKFNVNNSGVTVTGNITASGNLHAGDDTNISMDSSANGQLEVDGNGYQGAIALDANAMHLYHNSSNRSLVLGTNETARLTIGGTGGFNFESNPVQGITTLSSGAITSSGALSVNSGSANVVASFVSSDGTAGIKLQDNAGNIELSASGPVFQVQPSGGAASMQVSGTQLILASGVNITQTVPSSGGAYHVITHSGNEAWSWATQSGSGSDDYLDVGINGGTRAMSWHEDGKVGIGTSTPMSHLHVNKDTTGHNTDGITIGKVEVNGWIDTNEEMGRLSWAASYGTGSSFAPAIGAYISAKADANWNLNEAPTRLGFFTAPENSLTPVERMRISKDGKVGIGVATDPAAALEINRGSAPYGMILGSGQGAGRVMLFKDNHSSPNKYNWLVGSQYNINNAFEITPSTVVGGYTFTAGTGITILETGQVGIGTSSITSGVKLEVNGGKIYVPGHGIQAQTAILQTNTTMNFAEQPASGNSYTSPAANKTMTVFGSNSSTSGVAIQRDMANGYPDFAVMPGGTTYFHGNTTQVGAGASNASMYASEPGYVGIGRKIDSHEWKNWAGTGNYTARLYTPIVHTEGNMFQIEIDVFGYGSGGKAQRYIGGGYAYSGSTLIANATVALSGTLTHRLTTATHPTSGIGTVVVFDIGYTNNNGTAYYNHMRWRYVGWQQKNPADFVWSAITT